MTWTYTEVGLAVERSWVFWSGSFPRYSSIEGDGFITIENSQALIDDKMERSINLPSGVKHMISPR